MVQKKNTIDETLKDLIRDVEKLKEKPKEEFTPFDGIQMAEQMTVRATATLSDPVEVEAGLICGTSRVGFFEL